MRVSPSTQKGFCVAGRLTAVTLAALLLSALVATQDARAQVSLTNFDNPYEQNFNSFGTGNVNYVDNVTLQGWYVESAFTGFPNGGTLSASNGSGLTSANSQGRLFNFGTSSGLTTGDRALGSIAGGNRQIITYALQIQNNTGQDIDSFNLQWSFEQWYVSESTNSDNLTPSFLITSDPGNQAFGDSSGFPPLTAASVLQTSVGPAPLNGNANSVIVQQTVSNLNWQDGDYLWIRWTDINNDPGNGQATTVGDHAVALDDVFLTFEPVPAPPAVTSLGIGAAMGLLQLGVVRFRRRRGTVSSQKSEDDS